MNIIIASDIFGMTPSLNKFVKKLAKQAQVAIIDPYHGEQVNFKNEEQAYQAFIDEGGMDAYTLQLQNILTYIEQPVVLIGFSAGASALWRLIDKPLGLAAVHFIGFYPGQIRHYLEVIPHVPTTLLMPKHEQHFDINEIIAKLPKSELLSISQFNLEHGFMNNQSPGFNSKACVAFEQLISDTKLVANPGAFRAKKPSI